MEKYCDNGAEWVLKNLNANMNSLYKHKGCCRFAQEGRSYSGEIYRTLRSCVEHEGALCARVEIQDRPPPTDSA